MNGLNKIRHYSSESDSDGDYGYTHNRDVLLALKQNNGTGCIRCSKKVYPTEKLEVGVLLHKNCFRCKDCNLKLSLNNFVLARPTEQGMKDVYCKTHAPKLVSSTLDQDSMDIKSAVKAQKITRKESFHQPARLGNMRDWGIDPQAVSFKHAKLLQNRNRLRRPPGHDLEADQLDYESGAIIRKLRDGVTDRNPVRDMANDLAYSGNRKFPVSSDYMEPNCLWSPKQVQDPWNPVLFQPNQENNSDRHGAPPRGSDFKRNEPIYDTHRPATSEAIYESLQSMRTPEYPPRLPPRDPRIPIYQNRQQLMESLNETYNGQSYGQENDKRSRRRAGYENVTLQSRECGRDYFSDKAFRAQNELELRQRHEHGQMFRDFEKVRESQMAMLERDLKKQIEKAVNDLLMQIESGLFQGDMNVEKMKIEQRFQHLKDKEMAHLLDKLNSQERMRVEDMIDKQTQEMLELMDKKGPTSLPPAKPPKKRRTQLCSNPQVFDDVDFHAIQVAQTEQGSFTELVYELTRNCHTHLEKSRAIFRWITVKDLNKMMFREELTEENPYYFLQGIKYGLESYHQLFKRLCSYAGIPVKIIAGLSKSAGYRPGMPFNDGRFRNSWTAVYVEEIWGFVDCHWGARHVNSARESEHPDNFRYELDDFYFLTDPSDFLYMHFPDEPEWQLLEKPISLEAFLALPVVKSHFFRYNLKFISQVESVIESETGKVEVVLKRSESVHLAFNTRVESDEEVLDGYCIHHNNGKEVVFNLGLPRRGVFYFTIFACDTDKSDFYNTICSFRIKCTRVVDKPFCKFPKLPDGYGPTPLAEELGLVADKYKEYYLVCNEDRMTMNLKFKCHVKISHKLFTSQDNKEIDRLVFLRNRDKAFVSYLIRFPAKGIYVFSIFAARKDSDCKMLQCACRYLIQCNVNPSSCVKPYPTTHPHWMRCRLHEPTSGDLKINKNVKFKVEVQNGDAVAVIVGQQWFYLKRVEEGNVWEGVAHTGKDARVTLDVYARYKGNQRDFFPLLEYKLQND